MQKGISGMYFIRRIIEILILETRIIQHELHELHCTNYTNYTARITRIIKHEFYELNLSITS